MKAGLDLTSENCLLENVHYYDLKSQQNVSEPPECYFKNMTKPSGRESILDLVEKLDKPVMPGDGNLKEQYYKDNAGKYGF